MNRVQRYSYCCCVHSTIHGIAVPVGVVTAMINGGFVGDFLHAAPGPIDVVFAWTVSYFAFDLILILLYRGENWKVFVVHHIVGVMPFAINAFGCSNLHFLVGAGICVELANPFLNLRTLVDLYGLHNSEFSARCMYVTYAVWLVVRVSLPIYLTTGMIGTAMPAVPATWFTVPSYVTGCLITLFCVAVWLAILTPELLGFLRGDHRRKRAEEEKEENNAKARALSSMDGEQAGAKEEDVDVVLDVNMPARQHRQFRRQFRRKSSSLHIA